MKPVIVCGDCLQALTQMETGIADLALIDPPYFDYKTWHRKKGGDEKLSQSLVQQDREDQIRTVTECIRVLKDGSSFFFFTNWQEAWWFQEKKHSFIRNEIIWDKGNWAAGDLKGSLACRYEVIFLCIKGKGWYYNGSRIDDIWSNILHPDPKYDLSRVGTDRIHPTQKPVDLYKKVIELATKPGELILDPYCGSGASAIAAMATGRNFLGWEIDPEYHRRATSRVEEYAHANPDACLLKV